MNPAGIQNFVFLKVSVDQFLLPETEFFMHNAVYLTTVSVTAFRVPCGMVGT